MSDDASIAGYLGSFGLGLSAALLLVLLARGWSHRFLSAAGPRTRSLAFAAVGAVAGLSIVLLAVQARGPDGGPVMAASGALPARHPVVSTGGGLREAVTASVALLGRGGTGRGGTASSPQGELGALLAKAEEHRRKREFEQACEVYGTLVERGGMTAGSWADYADAQASLAGSLSGEPARAIEAALAIDPRHAKALWLEASLAQEEHRYRDAADTWQRLLAIVPPGSSDARIVEANLAEATRLASS
ncbi:MAG: hypothetical protein WBO04_06310 [Steroidobacteraceae bacterium]